MNAFPQKKEKKMFLFLPLLLLFVPISRGTTSPWCLSVQEVKARNEMTTTIGIVFWQISEKFLEDSGEFLLDFGPLIHRFL